MSKNFLFHILQAICSKNKIDLPKSHVEEQCHHQESTRTTIIWIKLPVDRFRRQTISDREWILVKSKDKKKNIPMLGLIRDDVGVVSNTRPVSISYVGYKKLLLVKSNELISRNFLWLSFHEKKKNILSLFFRRLKKEVKWNLASDFFKIANSRGTWFRGAFQEMP